MHRGAKGRAPHEIGDVVSADRDPVGLDACYRGIPDGVLVGFAHKTLSFHSLENFNHGTRQFTERINYRRARLAQRLHFASVCPSPAFDNCSRVTETRAFARRLAADVCDYWLGDLSIA